MLKLTRWDDDDAITLDILRMRITYLTSPNPFTTDICLHEFND
jgi:hypothetical protein